MSSAEEAAKCIHHLHRTELHGRMISVEKVGIINPYKQAFRFMVGPGQCPMISKYGPSLSKAVGPVDPSFLVVKKISLE